MQIKVLLALRRFRYVRSATLAVGLEVSFPEGYYLGLNQTKLHDYNHYLTGKYMPPVEMRMIDDE